MMPTTKSAISALFKIIPYSLRKMKEQISMVMTIMQSADCNKAFKSTLSKKLATIDRILAVERFSKTVAKASLCF